MVLEGEGKRECYRGGMSGTSNLDDSDMSCLATKMTQVRHSCSAAQIDLFDYIIARGLRGRWLFLPQCLVDVRRWDCTDLWSNLRRHQYSN